MRSIEFQPLRLVSATDKVAPANRVRAEDFTAKLPADVEVSLSALLGSKAPPIDHERIVELRNAIESGSYSLSPGKIADAMMETLQGTGSAR